MLSALSVILYGAAVLVSLLLIALVLVQPSKSGGFGSAFGGLGESVFGAQAMSHLSKLTVIFITVFFVVTLLLAVVAGHAKNETTTSVVAAEATAMTPDVSAKDVKKVAVETKEAAKKPAPAPAKK
ncbi:MAG: preprotein translocase subunit SecG [Lentisphaeria bacterium]|nr:preprotein translocase subunit SecG [Lentisphaeria bacterium]